MNLFSISFIVISMIVGLPCGHVYGESHASRSFRRFIISFSSIRSPAFTDALHAIIFIIESLRSSRPLVFAASTIPSMISVISISSYSLPSITGTDPTESEFSEIPSSKYESHQTFLKNTMLRISFSI